MDDRSHVETVFFTALEKTELNERAAFLEGACTGNEVLRRRVESLLAAHSHVGQFLERPVECVAVLGALPDPTQDLSFLAPSSEPDSLGRLNHYEVLEVVGSGGTGMVLRARDSKLHRIVALKVLAAPLAASSSSRQRFAREARAAAAVRDDHVIAIHAVEDHGPVPYLVMEFIDGGSLDALIRSGPPEVAEILRIGNQAASGLAAAHKQGLVHRDVKPANILLENGSQRVKLTDFGLARAADDTSLTQTGLIAGTPLYMAPEQAGDLIDARADLFSLGSVLYEMCTGQPAFRAKTTVAVIRRVCDETPRPIREINHDIPESLCQLIEQLHAKKPAERPASAEEVANQLTQLLAGPQAQSLAATPRKEDASQALLMLSRPLVWAAAMLVLVVVGLGLAEAGGLTDMCGTVIRLFLPEGTLVVEVDDPGVNVTMDGETLIISGAGTKEIRLKPGQYQLQASKDGKVVRQELVTVTRDGRQVVRITKESVPIAVPPIAAATSKEVEEWEKSVAALPAEQQAEAVDAASKN